MFGHIRRFPGSARRLYVRGPDSFTNLSIYGFGVSGLWTSVDTILLQFRVLEFADEDQKNGMLGAITLVGLVIAAATQPIAGAISDRSKTRWGKRLPYIVMGNLGLLVMTPFLGFANSFITLLLVIVMMQLFGNISQGPANALLMDHIPRHRRGVGAGALNLSRASGAGAVTVVVLLLMSQSGDDGADSGWYWASLGVVVTALFFSMTWTAGALRPRRSHVSRTDVDDRFAETASAAAIPLIPIIPVVIPVGTDPGESGSVISTTASHSKPGAALRHATGFYWFLLAMAMVVASLSAMQTFALFFIRDKVGLENPATGAAALTLSVGLGAAIAVYPSGAASDRFGRMPVLYIASVIAGSSAILLLLVSSITHLVILGAFIGIGAAMFLSSGLALVTELVPPNAAARSLGLTALATLIGSGLARISGFGIDALNRQSDGLGYDFLIVGMATLLILSLFPLRRAGIGLARSRRVAETSESASPERPPTPSV